MTQEEALKYMAQAGALEKGHFLMKSGRHADLFLQCAHLIEHADITGVLCQALAERCQDCGCDLVIAPALGGIIFGYEVSRALGKRFIYCERKDKVMTLRRGFRIPEGSRVLIVEDTVTTGGSVREVMEIVRAAGAETVQVAALVDRTQGKVELGVPFTALVQAQVHFYAPGEGTCPLCKAGVPMSPPRNPKN